MRFLATGCSIAATGGKLAISNNELIKMLRSLIVIIALAALAVAGYTVYDTLPTQGWFEHVDADTWEPVAIGWKLVPHLWPVVLLGLAVGAFIGLVFGVYAVRPATHLDLTAKISELQDALATTERARDSALEDARRISEKEVAELKTKLAFEIRQAEQLQEKAFGEMDRAKALQAQAAEIARSEQSLRQSAELRARNAIMTLKRKEAKFLKAASTGSVP